MGRRKQLVRLAEIGLTAYVTSLFYAPEAQG